MGFGYVLHIFKVFEVEKIFTYQYFDFKIELYLKKQGLQE